MSINNTNSEKPAIHPLLRITLIFLLIILSVVILKYGKPLLMPLAISAILAMLLSPLMDRMLKIGIPKWLTITVLILVLLFITAVVFFLIGRQVGVISQDWPQIEQDLMKKWDGIQAFIQKTFGIAPAAQEDRAKEALSGLGKLAMPFIGSVSQLLSNALLILIYLILMLMERPHFKKFVISLVHPAKKAEAKRAITACVRTSARYLFGRLIIMAILAGIYSLGFWVGQVPYAFFLGLIVALLSIIPFLGNIIGGGVAVVLAFVTSGLTSLLIVLLVIVIGQIIDNYILTPLIVGNAVKLNPFVTIVSIVAFSIVWGPIGAIIALPLTGMLRILLYNIEATRVYAFFLTSKEE